MLDDHAMVRSRVFGIIPGTVLGVALYMAMAGLACGGRAPRDGEKSSTDPRAHGSSEASRWAAVEMPHRQVRRALGGHLFEARHEVATTLGGRPERAYTDEYLLECRAKGDCHGRLNSSLEYGVELVRIGEETYFRHRYQPFLRFPEEREESERRVEHLFGVGAAVLSLLAPGVRLEPSGEAVVESRKAARYRLARRAIPRPVQGAEGARAWRARLTVDLAEGEVWLDRVSGAPLRYALRYRVSAPKGKVRLVLEGTLRAEVKAIGKAREVKPPAQYTEASPRDRELTDVRVLLGDQRLNPGWFRGGGPHAARERSRGAREAPAPGGAGATRPSPVRLGGPGAIRPVPTGPDAVRPGGSGVPPSRPPGTGP